MNEPETRRAPEPSSPADFMACWAGPPASARRSRGFAIALAIAPLVPFALVLAWHEWREGYTILYFSQDHDQLIWPTELSVALLAGVLGSWLAPCLYARAPWLAGIAFPACFAAWFVCANLDSWYHPHRGFALGLAVGAAISAGLACAAIGWARRALTGRGQRSSPAD